MFMDAILIFSAKKFQFINMESLFEDQHEPATRLIDSILILGPSVKSLRGNS